MLTILNTCDDKTSFNESHASMSVEMSFVLEYSNTCTWNCQELAHFDKFSKISFLGPYLCWRWSPLGPHLTQTWVPIFNKIGSPWHGSSAFHNRPTKIMIFDANRAAAEGLERAARTAAALTPRRKIRRRTLLWWENLFYCCIFL